MLFLSCLFLSEAISLDCDCSSGLTLKGPFVAFDGDYTYRFNFDKPVPTFGACDVGCTFQRIYNNDTCTCFGSNDGSGKTTCELYSGGRVVFNFTSPTNPENHAIVYVIDGEDTPSAVPDSSTLPIVYMSYDDPRKYPCNIAPRTFQPWDDFVKCFRNQTPFDTISSSGDNSEMEDVLSTIEKYYVNNPYVDWFKHPPSAYGQYAFDFNAEIDNLRSSLKKARARTSESVSVDVGINGKKKKTTNKGDDGGDINNNNDDIVQFGIGDEITDGFDFYTKLLAVIRKFRDGHAVFIAPCLRNFYYIFPFVFQVFNGETEDDFIEPHFLVSGAYLPSSLKEGGDDGEVSNFNYSGAEILSVDFSGGQNFVPMKKAISDWADAHGNAWFNPHSNWNEIIYDQLIVNVNMGDLPTSSMVSLQLLPDNGTYPDDIVNITAPWLGTYLGKQAPTLDALCPLHSKNTTSVSVTTPSSFSSSSSNTSTSSVSAQERLRMILKKQRKAVGEIGRERKWPFRNNRDAVQYFRETMTAAGKTIPTITPQWGETHTRPAQQTQKNEQKEEKTQQHSERKGEEAHRHAAVRAAIDSFVNADNDILVPIVEDVDNSLFIYVIPSRKILLYKLSTFSPILPGLYIDDFLTNFTKALNRHPEVTTLIIDVRGNGGGYLTILQLLMLYFFPTLRPVDQEFSWPKTDFLEDIRVLYQGMEGDDIIFSEWNSSVRITDFLAETRPVTFTDTANATYIRNFTKKYQWNMMHEPQKDFVGKSSPFDPQHTYIVTDGLCYSACGVFTKLASDTHSARLLGYSFNPLYNTPDGRARYNPGSCPANEMDSNQVEEWRSKDEFAPFFNNFTHFPPPFPREDELVGFTHSEAYSIDPEAHANGLPIYWRDNPVDDIIPVYENRFANESEKHKNLLFLATYVDNLYIKSPSNCFGWEVRAELQACSDQVPAGSHQVWGRPCTGEHFNNSICAFSRCENGYFQSAVQECSPLPVFPWEEEVVIEAKGKPAKFKILLVIVIGAAVAVVFVVVVVVVAVCVYVRRKKASKHTKGAILLTDKEETNF